MLGVIDISTILIYTLYRKKYSHLVLKWTFGTWNEMLNCIRQRDRSLGILPHRISYEPCIEDPEMDRSNLEIRLCMDGAGIN
jgi:hypothetical protein